MKYRKERKLSRRLLTAALVFAVLCACQKDDDSDDQTEGNTGCDRSCTEKLQLLNDSWITPEGTYGLEINGFTYRFWVWQKAELISAFTLIPGEPADSFSLNIGDEEEVTDRDGQYFCRITDMHYENGQIIMHIEEQDTGRTEQIILVTARSIEE